MSWNYKVNILSTDTVERFTPLTNTHYECIIKFIMGNDDAGLIAYLDHVVSSLCISQDFQWDQLNIIDKLFIFTSIRSICVSPIINITLTDSPKKNTRTVELFPFRSSIADEYVLPIVCKDTDYNMEVTVHYPRNWNENRLSSYITHISIDGTDIDVNTIDSKDIYKIIDQLTPHLHTKITEAREAVEKSVNAMTFFKPMDRDPITINLDELLYFIKLLYTEDFNNFIELNYVLVKLGRIGLADIMNLTPIDTQLYYKMYQREQAEREKQNAAAIKESRSI